MEPEEIILPDGDINPEQALEKKVLKPFLPLAITETNSVLGKGDVEICRIDTDSKEVPNSEFVSSLRMWDQVYSKDKQFKLKKK